MDALPSSNGGEIMGTVVRLNDYKNLPNKTIQLDKEMKSLILSLLNKKDK